ncbi:MAG TPA: hypothetical protein VFG99_10830 [Chloroflexia bacterium]|nr:hypothetical protein [Chloroflexia bacterium]
MARTTSLALRWWLVLTFLARSAASSGVGLTFRVDWDGIKRLSAGRHQRLPDGL